MVFLMWCRCKPSKWYHGSGHPKRNEQREQEVTTEEFVGRAEAAAPPQVVGAVERTGPFVVEQGRTAAAADEHRRGRKLRRAEEVPQEKVKGWYKRWDKIKKQEPRNGGFSIFRYGIWRIWSHVHRCMTHDEELTLIHWVLNSIFFFLNCAIIAWVIGLPICLSIFCVELCCVRL